MNRRIFRYTGPDAWVLGGDVSVKEAGGSTNRDAYMAFTAIAFEACKWIDAFRNVSIERTDSSIVQMSHV